MPSTPQRHALQFLASRLVPTQRSSAWASSTPTTTVPQVSLEQRVAERRDSEQQDNGPEDAGLPLTEPEAAPEVWCHMESPSHPGPFALVPIVLPPSVPPMGGGFTSYGGSEPRSVNEHWFLQGTRPEAPSKRPRGRRFFGNPCRPNRS